MTIYLLRRIGRTDYDEIAGYVVIAATPEEARGLAAHRIPGPGWAYTDDDWLDPGKTRCLAVGTTEPGRRARVLLCDFRAG